jgi:hypothetical protein
MGEPSVGAVSTAGPSVCGTLRASCATKALYAAASVLGLVGAHLAGYAAASGAAAAGVALSLAAAAGITVGIMMTALIMAAVITEYADCVRQFQSPHLPRFSPDAAQSRMVGFGLFAH